MKRKYLTEEQYDVCMRALGYKFDAELEHYFIGEKAFICNVQDNINDVNDLITFDNNGYPTFMAQILTNSMSNGENFIISDGTIDDYGVKHKKGLYCTNYRELYSKENKVRTK